MKLRARQRKAERSIPKPPPVLDCARLLHYAVVEKSIVYSGRTLLFVDGKEVGRVPCLAICEYEGSKVVLLFHCKRDWRVIGCSAHKSVSAAKKRAEGVYPGLSSHWREAHVTNQRAERFLNELFGNVRCIGCEKRPAQVGQLFTKGRALVCDSCVQELHKMMQDRPNRRR
jgi:hypothetical protein